MTQIIIIIIIFLQIIVHRYLLMDYLGFCVYRNDRNAFTYNSNQPNYDPKNRVIVKIWITYQIRIYEHLAFPPLSSSSIQDVISEFSMECDQNPSGCFAH